MTSNPSAGVTHDVVFQLGSDSYGFMLKQGTQVEERVNDFAPSIGLGDNPAFAEGAWRAWEQSGFTEGVDQRLFSSKQKCWWTDGNIDTTRDQITQLGAAWASSDASKVATAPMIVDFLQAATDVVLAAIGTKIRRFNTSTEVWADSTTTLGASATFLYMHGANAFAACGAGADFYRSADGDTWAQPAAGQKASCFATWAEKLYLGYTNTIKSSTDNGATWSAAVNIGDPSTNILNMISAFNDLLFIRKEDGLYYYDGTNVVEVYHNNNNLYAGNKTLFYHVNDGYMYMGELGSIKKFSISSGTITNMVDVTPSMLGDAAKELYGHGTPIWIWSGPQYLYCAFDDGEGLYPEILKYNGLGWHQVYRGTSGDTLNAAGYSRLMGWNFLNDGATRRQKMVTLKEIPRADYPASGQLMTGYFDAGLPQMPKGFGSVRVWARNVSAANYITVDYRTRDDEAWTTLGTITSDVWPNPTTILFSTANKSIGANAIQLRFTITTASATATPVLERFSVKYLNRPLTVHAYSMVLNIK